MEWCLIILVQFNNVRKESADKNLTSGQQWLLQEIQDNGYWIRKERVKWICRKLSIQFHEPSYYRDLRVWFPELEGGIACTPKCPSCSRNTRVSFHGYRKQTLAQNVVCLTTNYFIMSRRYICHTCKANYMQAKNDAAGKPIKKIQYTFMEYNSEVLRSFSFGFEQKFPVFLTHRAGVDLSIIDLMQPLFDKGRFRPTALSELLLELHAKKYTKDYIKREGLLEQDICSLLRVKHIFDCKCFQALPTTQNMMVEYQQAAVTCKWSIWNSIPLCVFAFTGK